jgi:hypothetical protein
MSTAYQSAFPKKKGFKVILPDANDSPVHPLKEWKRKLENMKELAEERKEMAKRRSENTQQQDNSP